jgi:hypothetical protein
MEIPLLSNGIAKNPNEQSILPDPPEVLPRIRFLPMASGGAVGARDFDELVPECAIAIAHWGVVVAALVRDDHDRLGLRKELQCEVGEGGRANRPYLATAPFDEC